MKFPSAVEVYLKMSCQLGKKSVVFLENLSFIIRLKTFGRILYLLAVCMYFQVEFPLKCFEPDDKTIHHLKIDRELLKLF